MPHLRRLGVVRGAADFDYAELLSHAPIDLAAAAAAIDPGQLATVIYTSGTTGPPKGVMLTHHNIAWTVESLFRAIARDDLAGKRVISYLPMAHIAERMTSHYQGMFFGYEVATCPDAALLAPYCREVRPEILFGVPRVWEKFHAGVTASLSADPDRATKFNAAVEAALPIVEAQSRGSRHRRTRGDAAVPRRCRVRATARTARLRCVDVRRQWRGADSARVVELVPRDRSPAVRDLRSVGVERSDDVGPVEGPRRHRRPGDTRLRGASRRPMARSCAAAATSSPGYLDDPEKTAEAIDAEGFLHSGDIGVFDDDGYLRIVDRKKELIITAGGKNISPANLEAKLKLVPLIGQAAVIGDSRPFVSALVVLEPQAAAAFADREGISYASVADLADDAKVVDAIAAGIADVMSEFNNAERVKKWTVLGDEWLPDSDELTPTSKLKRRIIAEKYAAEIEAMYR